MRIRIRVTINRFVCDDKNENFKNKKTAEYDWLSIKCNPVNQKNDYEKFNLQDLAK